MDDKKNVFLRIVHEDNETQDGSLVVDFGLIWKRMKRYVAIWLCLAVGLGALSGAGALFARNSILLGKAEALIWLADSGYDISKIKSPSVIADALNKSGMDTDALETVRNAITVEGVIPGDAYERMSMYYDMIERNIANSDIIHSLLDTDYEVSEYVVSLDYSKANVKKEDGILFLNALLRAYQDYCFSLYNSNTALQNPLNSIDYRDYDYAEAANIFSNTLDDVSLYLRRLNSQPMAEGYRSHKTGFTFADLLKIASSLKEIDLDRAASYIMIHSVSDNNAEAQVSYYGWLIENLEQLRAVQRTRLASLTDAINSYDKDSIVVLSGQDGNFVATDTEDMNANYDAMIQEKLNTQALISTYNRSISYYQSVIDGFTRTEDNTFISNQTDIEIVKGYLDNLYGNLTELIENVSLTANEYYEKVSFADQIRVLVPAILDIPSSSIAIKVVAALEGILLFIYLCVSFVLGVHEANPRRQKEKSKEEEQPAPLTE